MSGSEKAELLPGPYEDGLFTIADMCADGSVSVVARLDGDKLLDRSRLPHLIQQISPDEIEFISAFTQNHEVFIQGDNFMTEEGSLYDIGAGPLIIRGIKHYEDILITGAVGEQLVGDPYLESMWVFYFKNFGIAFETYFSDVPNSLRTYIAIVPPYNRGKGAHPINWANHKSEKSSVAGFIDRHVVMPARRGDTPDYLTTIVTLQDIFVDEIFPNDEKSRSVEITFERFRQYRMAMFFNEFFRNPLGFKENMAVYLRNLYGFNNVTVENLAKNFGNEAMKSAVKKSDIKEFVQDLSGFYDLCMERIAVVPDLKIHVELFLKAITSEVSLWPEEYASNGEPNSRRNGYRGILQSDLDELRMNTFRRH